MRRAGYCYRQPYDTVLLRYKMLCDDTWPNYRRGTTKEGVQEIMKVSLLAFKMLTLEQLSNTGQKSKRIRLYVQ